MSQITDHNISWDQFATVKRWKKQLGKRNHKGSLSLRTWTNCKFWMLRFLKCTKLNPEELIKGKTYYRK